MRECCCIKWLCKFCAVFVARKLQDWLHHHHTSITSNVSNFATPTSSFSFNGRSRLRIVEKHLLFTLNFKSINSTSHVEAVVQIYRCFHQTIFCAENIFFKLNSFSVCKEARPGSLTPEYLVASLSWYLKRERGNKNPFKPHKLEIPEILSTEDQSVRGAPIIAAIFSWLRNSGEQRELEPLGTDPSSVIMQQSCKVLQSTAQIRANSRFNRTVQYRVFLLFLPHHYYYNSARCPPVQLRNFCSKTTIAILFSVTLNYVLYLGKRSEAQRKHSICIILDFIF